MSLAGHGRESRSRPTAPNRLTASDTDATYDWEIRVIGSTVEPYAIYIY